MTHPHGRSSNHESVLSIKRGNEVLGIGRVAAPELGDEQRAMSARGRSKGVTSGRSSQRHAST